MRDRELNRVVAMKIVHAAHTHRSHTVSRFIEEAQATAQLQHPNIVPVHDAGILPDGRCWFTMREVRGRSMADAIADLHAGRGSWSFRPPGRGAALGQPSRRLRPRPRGDPPGPEAPQRGARRPRRGLPARLGTCQGPRAPRLGRRARRGPHRRSLRRRAPGPARRQRLPGGHRPRGVGLAPDPGGHRHRDAGVHGARAGPRRDRSDRRTLRRVRAWGDAVRGALRGRCPTRRPTSSRWWRWPRSGPRRRSPPERCRSRCRSRSPASARSLPTPWTGSRPRPSWPTRSRTGWTGPDAGSRRWRWWGGR